MAPKRSLILAGGGIKVAFQAGVLQVWLDEAKLAFDHADGASGGMFNLAMWCQGMTGTAIADAWRRTNPAEGISLNISQLPKLAWARSLFTLDAYRSKVFPTWGLDFDAIRGSDKSATFNVYNFTRHELEVLSPAQMDEDFLCACVSLPMWFEPVVRDGSTYIDPVYISDANIEEAIRRGADEVWVIWTVSMRGEWADGFVANYFQIIEAAANGQFKRIKKRIDDSNAALASGGQGEFGRTITLKLLQEEVPLHYLVDFSQDRLVECVNLGVERARAWCKAEGIALTPGPDAPVDVHTVKTTLQFSEVMRGFVARGERDYEAGFVAGKRANKRATASLTIKVDGVNTFITSPQHEAQVEGTIDCAEFGGARPVLSGTFNLFVEAGDTRRRAMYYRLWFQDLAGRPLTMIGFKDVRDDAGFDVWSDTTTLYTRILEGHRGPNDDEGANILGAGIIQIHFTDFLRELTTFRVEAPSLLDRTAALTRFGKLFLGKLWDVYATQILSSGPF